MHLECERSKTINYICVVFFIAVGASGLLFFRCPDQWGCRKTLAVFGSVSIFAQFILLFVPTYYARMAGYILLGIGYSKNSASYAYIFGEVRNKDKAVCCGVVNTWDCLTAAVMAVYFTFVSKDWFYFCLVTTFIALTAGVIVISFAPDSPRWLVAKGRQEDAVRALNKIAAYNFSKNRIPLDATFEEFQTQQLTKTLNQSSIHQISRVIEPESPDSSKSQELWLFVKLTIASIISYFVTMTTLWSAASLPGSHIYAHMVQGLGEASSCFIASLLCRFYKDRLVFTCFCAVGLLGLNAFYFIAGGSSASVTGLIFFFVQVVGCGGVYSVQFLLIEQRV